MNLSEKEIYETLAARPELVRLFEAIFNLPEEKRSEAVKVAMDYFNEVSGR